MKKSTQRIVAIAGSAALLTGAGVAYAAWTTNGTGSGSAEAVSAEDLTTETATTTAQLYPGGSGDLVVVIKNTNDYPVKVTQVKNSAVTTDAITSNKGTACDASTGVSFTDKTGLSLLIPANSSASHTLVGAVSMTNASDTTCQAAVFTIPVDLVGASNAA